MSLTVRAVRHCYGDRPVLRGVSFELPAGRSLAVTGPSGSGKTTLLSVIGGLLRPSSGEASIGGLRADLFARAVPGGIAWVFQTTNAFGARTLLDNVMLAPLARGVEVQQARERSVDALTAVGLGAHMDALAREVSGGELQRACIARAVATRPALILADEPTGQLDAETSAVVADVLFSAALGDSMLVVASHDLRLAAGCDEGVALENGRVVPRAAQ